MNSFTSKMKENLLGNPSYPCVYYKGVLGTKPSLILFYQNQELHVQHPTESFTMNLPPLAAVEFLEELLTNLPKQEFTQLMGYFSFEFGLKLQNNKLNKTKLATQKIRDFYFILPTEYQFFDAEFNPIKTVTLPITERVFETPNQTFAEIKQNPAEFSSNLSKKEYNQALEKIRKLIIDGETYQVNFAQKWSGTSNKTPLQIFEELFKINPSSHQAILYTANFSIISNSPECLFVKEKNSLKTYPIKGTLPSSKDPKELLESKKDQAELEMIVDLERNDLGQIAKAGTVKVTKHRYLETYSNVHHTLSEISCKVDSKIKFSQIFKSLFPGGSITGCPKFRTSQFIHDLEPDLREYYCGSLGFINQNGNSEFNILIRTILNIGQNCYFHSGGGITIQSIDGLEYEETIHKASNLIKVLSS